ncbi:hypothetical protein WMZ97_12930 [Lentibacillus sp. N15]
MHNAKGRTESLPRGESKPFFVRKKNAAGCSATFGKLSEYRHEYRIFLSGHRPKAMYHRPSKVNIDQKWSSIDPAR